MFSMGVTIEYLDLAIPNVDRKVTRLDQFRHNCYFNNQFKHNTHGENPHSNSITDILISLGLNLEKQVNYCTEINERMREIIVSKNNVLKELSFNIEYV